MTLPPLHHGRDDDASRPSGADPAAGPGPRLRAAYVFTGVLFACAFIGLWTLRLLGLDPVSLPAALGIVAASAVVAALVTRAQRR